uniref:Uncharacterized protein n=1 Tax=Pipistrellus kuhlii TaxID=59472 RepID=A0A7J8B281_PIPKU|nr:hypothetical protein mPipKuh1_007684 [Pipistrellus kuhlii]
MAAASLSAREHDPGKERPSPGQRRSGVSKTPLVPVKVQDLRPEGSPPEVLWPGGVAIRAPAPRRTTPAGVDVNHGNTQRAAAGRRGAVTSLQLVCLPVGIADLLPAGGPNLFTRRNAAQCLPVHHLFPRVTRETAVLQNMM